MGRIRDALLREYEQNSQENGYVLSQIARHYADGLAPTPTDGRPARDQIAALTGDKIQQAAQTYLKSSDYVKVTLMPAK